MIDPTDPDPASPQPQNFFERSLGYCKEKVYFTMLRKQ
jgi:hypothetical protein